MRQLVLSPRWVLWHLLTLGAMATCGFLAAWQWSRAGSEMGSALNVGYGLQWPVFAVFFGVMWWRMLRMEAARLRAGAPDGEPAAVQQVDARSAPAAGVVAPPRARDAGPSPFGPRPASARPAPVEEGSGLAAYNRMLAELAARPQD